MFSEKENKNNKVIASGTIRGGFAFSHEVFGEKFYETKLDVERASGAVDEIPVMVSERLVCVNDDWDGQKVVVSGNIRSHNKREGGKNRLLLHLFAREFMPCAFDEEDNSEVFLDGYLCKEPFYRETPLGREICEVMLAVNRKYRKSDYIPCILWGRNARFSGVFDIGEHVVFHGRMQSRRFTKRISDTEQEERTTYEVSVNKMEVLEDAEQEDD